MLIFDFREDFEKVHIRDSFHVHPGLNRGNWYLKAERVLEVIDLAERKACEKEVKYTTIQKVRRYFFVGSTKLESNNEGVQFVLKCLS